MDGTVSEPLGYASILLNFFLVFSKPLGFMPTVNKKEISRLMAYLGRSRSPAKVKAAQENGRKGGRPPMKKKVAKAA